MNNNSADFSAKNRSEEPLPFNIIFEGQAGLVVVLSPDLFIRAATDAYLRETLTNRNAVLGRYIFEVFPDNPAATGTSASENLKASLVQVLVTGKPQVMDVFQYDIPDPDNPGGFVERFWKTINSPVFNNKGEVIYIIHETSNVTETEKARVQLQTSQEREKIAKAQAEQQRIRLERLFEQAPAALAILEGPDLVFKVINSSYQQLFPGRELQGLPLFEALPELKDSAVYDIIYKVYNTGETFEGKEINIPVARFENQDPEDIYWNFIYQAIFDETGKVNGILIFALDVTPFVDARLLVEKNAGKLQELNLELEQRVAERTRELEWAKAEATRQWRQLEMLFMSAPAAITILDGPELVFQLINPVYQQIFPGRSLLGKPVIQALPEIIGTPIPDILMEVYRTGKPYVAHEVPLMMARHEGSPLEEIYWTFTYQPRHNSEEMIDGVMVFAYEVTDQVKARISTEASARQIKLITDSLPVLIGYIDKEERYQFANKACERWFGVNAQELVGKKLKDVIGEKAYSNVENYIQRALAGERLDFEATMPYREGFIKHIRTSYVPDFKNDRVAGFYTLVTDITEQVESRKRVEQSALETQLMAQELAKTNEEIRIANQDLALANQQLIHTNIDLDNFIYTASHDLKAPISNIEMLIDELLLELPEHDSKSSATSQIIKLIKDAIDRFKKTINNLTEISKLQQGKYAEATLINCAEVIREVQLDLEPLINTTGGELIYDFKENYQLSFSEKNMRSIVYNLLSNAFKYRHPDRKPVVKVSLYEAEDNYVVLRVEDNGLGLSASNQTKLYGMFKRFHDHVEGTGIGLYMVKRIVDNAGGKIDLISKPNKGSVFQVYFKKNA